jgi:hypothetical protein
LDGLTHPVELCQSVASADGDTDLHVVKALLFLRGLFLFEAIPMVSDESQCVIALGDDTVVFVQREQASDLVDIECDGIKGYSLCTRS